MSNKFIIKKSDFNKLDSPKIDTRGYLLFYKVGDKGNFSICSVDVAESQSLSKPYRRLDEILRNKIMISDEDIKIVPYHYHLDGHIDLENFGRAIKMKEDSGGFFDHFLFSDILKLEIYRIDRSKTGYIIRSVPYGIVQDNTIDREISQLILEKENSIKQLVEQNAPQKET